MRIFGFVAMAVLGYLSIFVVLVGSLQLGVIDALPADEYLMKFHMVYLVGGLAVAIAATLIGVGNFFARGRARKILFLFPLVVPLTYSIIMLAYFSTLPINPPAVTG